MVPWNLKLSEFGHLPKEICKNNKIRKIIVKFNMPTFPWNLKLSCLSCP